MRMDKQISVVIPSYNSYKTITYTLDSLLRQKGNYIKEIIVVDSSDNPEMKNIIKKYSSRIKFINAGIRVMPALGRNLGASHAKGKILAFLDSDAIAVEDWAEKIFLSYQKGYKAGGGGVELPEFQRNNSIAAAQYYLQLNEFIPAGQERVKSILPGVNIFCERKIFNKAGGFPEVRASEDTLFGLAVSKHTQYWFVPGITVAHIFREDLKGFLNNQEMLGKYIILYRKQYYSSMMYRGIIPVLLFPGIILFKVGRMIWRISVSRHGELFRFLKVLPLFMKGMFYWSKGFIQGCFQQTYN
jgi:glycosyltransferase involved in cell wall biosynthesis